MNKLSDEYLMQQVQKGHLRFAGLLFERYKKMLYAFFYNQTKNTVLCDDLVQVTFYRLIKYKHNFRGDSGFKPWIYTIARNAMKDELRKNSKARHQDIDVYQNHFVEKQGADINIEQQEKRAFLDRALSMLTSEKREILTLVKLNEKKYKEVANILQIKESAVKSKVFRAIQELQKNYIQMTKTI